MAQVGCVEAQEARGTIALAQEDRFRLQTADGRSLLFVLGDGVGLARLASLAEVRRPVVVCYKGEPEAGAVAVRVSAA